MTPENEETRSLSVEGRARRDRMLHDLLHDMKRVHRRRKATRRIAAVSIVPVLAALTWIAWLAAQPSTVSPRHIARQDSFIEHPQSPESAVQTQANRLAEIEVVHTDPSVSAAFVVSTVSNPTLSDDELLSALAALNRPTGLVRSGNLVWLTNEVADRIVAQ